LVFSAWYILFVGFICIEIVHFDATVFQRGPNKEGDLLRLSFASCIYNQDMSFVGVSFYSEISGCYGGNNLSCFLLARTIWSSLHDNAGLGVSSVETYERLSCGWIRSVGTYLQDVTRSCDQCQLRLGNVLLTSCRAVLGFEILPQRLDWQLVGLQRIAICMLETRSLFPSKSRRVIGDDYYIGNF